MNEIYKIDILLNNDIKNIKKTIVASNKIKTALIINNIRIKINFITLVNEWIKYKEKQKALIVIKAYIEGHVYRKLLKKKLD